MKTTFDKANMKYAITLLTVVLLGFPSSLHAGETIRTEILIVGGTESGWAAAIQAARMGCESITIVHDGRWLGGQYTEQGLACVDESKGPGKVGWGPAWHPMKRSFHRFGLFKELMDRIEAFNTTKYGSPMPGKPMHGPTTFRPAEAEAIFRDMLQPYIASGQVTLKLNHLPIAALTSANAVTGMTFRSEEGKTLEVQAAITIDASDWGDVVQLSGAEFEVGPDPKSRYGEPSAQADTSVNPPNEMNPITWTLIVEEGEDDSPIAAPPGYDERSYFRCTSFGRQDAMKLKWEQRVKAGNNSPWPAKGTESRRQGTVLTMRRLVEGTTSTDGITSALICYANGQDYPLERLPRHVCDALEATEPGASMKNIVLMTREQRQIVFENCKAHSLGLLHHLQTTVHDRAADKANSLRHFHLSTEFGTPDRLPMKPYIRESLRLKSLYMIREQDGLTRGKTAKNAKESFAHIMYPDSVFAWQFHYDFHDTGRTYLKDEGDTGPWTHYEKPGRGVHNLSDRSVFPLRSLIPVKMDGLIGAQGNVGFSSIVSSAIRLHDHRVHIGQAAGALAMVALHHQSQPRDLAWSRERLEEIQHAICGGTETTPMLLWPWRDLPADHAAFVAINRLSARGLIPTERDKVDFRPDAPAEKAWRDEVLTRCSGYDFELRVGEELTRGEFAHRLWNAIQDQPAPAWQRHESNDADADGVHDLDDPQPFGAWEW
ncbi:FAD-dependent oxidoreductase [Aporhodopirellula aestuarii]|uniref:FAD-dependent oxidoreductase n=1 Tax=Aporhodopirellula aestuarii TaxID=2950107 RepID=A0ABT0TWU6_9BACT|nr:FAD-dependent oxidoreductase [Aporhodopirellula aestuarii]MCM2369092.1 FAD-dependent oxidoreductase [Aporhodopirellula aestuarii]